MLDEEDKVLVVEAENYTMRLEGNNILNYDNELSTKVFMEERNGRLELIVNEGKLLPGKVTVTVGENHAYDYLYLSNAEKSTYERLEYNRGDEIYIDMEGRYVLSNEKLDGFQFQSNA